MSAAVIPYITLALTAVSGVQQYDANRKAARAQEEAAMREKALAARNAERIRAETAEKAHRTKQQQSAELAANRARLAASGVTLEGSTGSFLTEMDEAMQRELAWLEQAGESQARITEEGGANTYLTGLAEAEATRAGGISGAMKTFAGGMGTAYNQGAFGS